MVSKTDSNCPKTMDQNLESPSSLLEMQILRQKTLEQKGKLKFHQRPNASTSVIQLCRSTSGGQSPLNLQIKVVSMNFLAYDNESSTKGMTEVSLS